MKEDRNVWPDLREAALDMLDYLPDDWQDRIEHGTLQLTVDAKAVHVLVGLVEWDND